MHSTPSTENEASRSAPTSSAPSGTSSRSSGRSTPRAPARPPSTPRPIVATLPPAAKRAPGADPGDVPCPRRPPARLPVLFHHPGEAWVGGAARLLGEPHDHLHGVEELPGALPLVPTRDPEGQGEPAGQALPRVAAVLDHLACGREDTAPLGHLGDLARSLFGNRRDRNRGLVPTGERLGDHADREATLAEKVKVLGPHRRDLFRGRRDRSHDERSHEAPMAPEAASPLAALEDAKDLREDPDRVLGNVLGEALRELILGASSCAG